MDDKPLGKLHLWWLREFAKLLGRKGPSHAKTGRHSHPPVSYEVLQVREASMGRADEQLQRPDGTALQEVR